MKRFLPFYAILICMTYSCSSDDDADDTPAELPANAILGTWDATEFRSDDEDAEFAKQLLARLTADECVVLTLIFREDGTVTTENAVNELEFVINADSLDIPCPEQRDTESGTYVYNGSELTLQQGDGEPVTASVLIDDNTMEVDASSLDEDNFDYEGVLVFKKR